MSKVINNTEVFAHVRPECPNNYVFEECLPKKLETAPIYFCKEILYVLQSVSMYCTVCNTLSMVNKKRLNKKHSLNFQKNKKQSLVILKKLGNV